MGILSVAKNYLVWHYSTAYVDMLRVWRNYLWFINHLFSVPEVLMSWFAPFKRLHEERANLLLHPQEFFSGLVVNIIMRIVGTVIRTALLLLALGCFVIVFIGGLVFFLLWTSLPVVVILCLRYSLLFLFQ